MKLKTPIIIVNFKTYPQGVGKNAEELAKKCEQVAIETGKSIAISVTAADLFRVTQAVKIPVLSEHMDPDAAGSHTGKVLAEDIKENGAIGTLLNHSEDRYRLDRLEAAVRRAKEAGLVTVVCANNSEIAEAVAAWEPDYIAVEPPELIGTGVSVSKANPAIVTETVAKVKRIDPNIPVLCGAGVMNGEDVKKALELGAHGVLLASGVVKADDPVSVLRDMASGL